MNKARLESLCNGLLKLHDDLQKVKNKTAADRVWALYLHACSLDTEDAPTPA